MSRQSAVPTAQILQLLDKMGNVDKDYRYMATSDLINELQKEIKLDEESEKKVVKTLLKLLEDKNGEVQNMAVKGLGPLVGRVNESSLDIIVETLCGYMSCSEGPLRDISSMGLKSVTNDLSPQLGMSVCKRITPRLITAISQAKDVNGQLESLDILSDMLAKFGLQMVSFHPQIQEILLPLLSSPRLAVRKRSSTALSHLLACTACPPTIYKSTMEFLLLQLRTASQAGDSSLCRSLVHTIGLIARNSGPRFGEHLSTVVPLIVPLTGSDDDELREVCIQALESCVRRCPSEIAPHMNTVVGICLQAIEYDPNYSYDDEGDDEDMEMDNEDDDESDQAYSDDDDMSWKVRRAAAKCLEAVVSSRHYNVVQLQESISPRLIARFKEREENVKVDIFAAYVALLRQCRPLLAQYRAHHDMETDGGSGTAAVDGLTSNGNQLPADNKSAFAIQCYTNLVSQVGVIVNGVHKLLREKSIKTRQGVFTLLTELIHAHPGILTDQVANLTPGILYSLGEKNSSSNMKIDTLIFLGVLLRYHTAQAFHPHIKVLLPAVVAAVNDPFYKITSEGLNVLTLLVRAMRPEVGQHYPSFEGSIDVIYTCTVSRLRAADIDQEVKERAITCTGAILGTFGDCMPAAALQESLQLLHDRLNNEITRLTCVKALTTIAMSTRKIDWDPLLPAAFQVLSSFLRKNQRALRLTTLNLLDCLVKNYIAYFTPDVCNVILVEVPPLLNESDLHISQLTLTMLRSLILTHQAFLPIIPQNILPEALVLLRSPLLQGGSLAAMISFFEAIIRSGFSGLGYDELLRRLVSPAYAPSPTQGVALHKQAYISISKCVSSVSLYDERVALETVNKFTADIANKGSVDSVKHLALLIIGEIGKRLDLTPIANLRDVILAEFSSSNEEVKGAACFALGGLSVGNMNENLPFVIGEIEKRDKRQYLLLHSLKEVISSLATNSESVAVLEVYLESIWSLLMHHCECPEEGTRNMVAECLGKLTVIKPQLLLPRLKTALSAAGSPLARSTIVTSVKFTISDTPHSLLDTLLAASIGDFLATLQDEDLNVRRVALITFNSAAHNKPQLIRDLLTGIMPRLYAETKVRKELIREVEMGPFKHTVDDGLDIRKAAFECMYTLLDTCLDRLDVFVFLEHIEEGLRDHSDIKMLSYLMLARLCVLYPNPVLSRLEQLIEPLKVTCTSKVKSNAVKQEYEKSEELKRSALRAFRTLERIPDADKNHLITDFQSQIRGSEELRALYDSVDKDTHGAGGVDPTSPMDVN